MKKTLVLLTLALSLFLLVGCTSDEVTSDNKQNSEVVSSSSSENSNEGVDDNAETSNSTSTESGGSAGGDGWTNQY